MLMFMHLGTVVPAFFIGTLLLLIRKGTVFHKRAGRVFMILMIVTAAIALFMPAHVGSRFLGHFGWIHSFCVITLISAPFGWYAAVKGNIRGHQINMILLYFGALIIAGGFTFVPGRYLHELFFPQ